MSSKKAGVSPVQLALLGELPAPLHTDSAEAAFSSPLLPTIAANAPIKSNVRTIGPRAKPCYLQWICRSKSRSHLRAIAAQTFGNALAKIRAASLPFMASSWVCSSNAMMAFCWLDSKSDTVTNPQCKMYFVA
ncbi:hypothetical protein O9993_00410 [Vibrio lentus]|nr:hypothetical protein [Vibrio lentus]